MPKISRFLSTLSLRRATENALCQIVNRRISIHALLAESDGIIDIINNVINDFYPRSPCGERLELLTKWFCDTLFLSTLSLRRATIHHKIRRQPPFHFYPRSPCGERRQERMNQLSPKAISIHALLAESDCAVSVQVGGNVYFYPRSPCGERLCLYRLSLIALPISIHALLAESDEPATTGNDKHNIFLSTLSLRRATTNGLFFIVGRNDFYPRSPCGERQPSSTRKLTNMIISIHALLAESDLAGPSGPAFLYKFLSTLSLRRATLRVTSKTRSHPNFYPRSPCGERLPPTSKTRQNWRISIHALLAESDANWFDLWGWAEYFYPRSPCGERLELLAKWFCNSLISIHALLAESDCVWWMALNHLLRFLSTLSLRRATLAGPSGPAFLYNFYPRSPCGERPWKKYPVILGLVISIHALLAESDDRERKERKSHRHFYPRSPCGERPPQGCFTLWEVLFLSTLSLRRATTRRAPRQQPAGISIHALLAESDL